MFRLAGVLLVLLTYQLVAQGKVGIIAREEGSSNSQRTLFNIVWGCVSTTIICAWAAIHPNIPPREGPLKRTLRRLELMFWTIVAPEILPCWALNQLLAAVTVRDVYNEGKDFDTKGHGIWKTVKRWFSLYEIREVERPGWTVAHGHFLIMGGFHVVEPPETRRAAPDAPDESSTNAALVEETNGRVPSGKKGRVTILTLEMLRELVKDPKFEIQMTEQDISDRSKGDALSKLIFIMQSTWFILQCLGRRVQGLNLTHLELTTLALASLNGITFSLWWDKPLGALAIVRVDLKRELTDSERQVRMGDRDPDHSARTGAILLIFRIFKESVTTIRDAFVCQSNENLFVVWLVQLPFAILLLLLSPIIAFAFVFIATLLDLVLGTSYSFPPDNTHVPTLYVPNHRFTDSYHTLLLIILGAIFGGIHCSGWNFPFSTHMEQILWRAASLAVTTIPIATFPLALIIHSIDGRLSPTAVPFLSIPVVLTLFLCAVAYVSARLLLLGLALSLMRHLSPAAFIAIDWTKFYPHIL